MKIFVCLCALLPLFQTAVSSTSEKDLYSNIVLNTEIKDIIYNISMFIFKTDHQAKFMAETFFKNVNDLRLKYGEEKYLHFQRKYGNEAAEFAQNPELSKDCSQYIADLLKENETYQSKLSEYIAEAIAYLERGFNNLYLKFVNISIALEAVEREAHNCGALLEENNEILAYNCMVVALTKARTIENEVIDEIFKEVSNLGDRTNRTLTRLNQSVKDRSIPEFYNEDGIDGWLEKFCS